MELEYMVVDRETLDVKPIADEVIRVVAGSYANQVERGAVAWSNELVMHVIELKTNGPAHSLEPLSRQFQAQVQDINRILGDFGARLMPAAMHPWMNPFREMRLWPHEYNPIYEAYDRIFNCKGHGWANLQSTHINLPFADDEEFGRLHAAIRVVLPLLPAIAAASPVFNGEVANYLDQRLAVYRTNSLRIPSITGLIIPERAYTRDEYEHNILDQLYRDISSHDPEKILQEEWLNSRGAIARFDRNTIEIRVLDNQECPMADLAVVTLAVETIRGLVEERWSGYELQKQWDEKVLYEFLLNTIDEGDKAIFNDTAYLGLFGLEKAHPVTAAEIWRGIAGKLKTERTFAVAPLEGAMSVILEKGPLARRLLNSLPAEPTHNDLVRVYGKLCDCLQEGAMYCEKP